MIRSQVLSGSTQNAVLKRLPNAITCRPRDADVMPFPVVDEEGQFCDLQQADRHYSILYCILLYRLLLWKNHQQLSWSSLIPLLAASLQVFYSFLEHYSDLPTRIPYYYFIKETDIILFIRLKLHRLQAVPVLTYVTLIFISLKVNQTKKKQKKNPNYSL